MGAAVLVESMSMVPCTCQAQRKLRNQAWQLRHRHASSHLGAPPSPATLWRLTRTARESSTRLCAAPSARESGTHLCAAPSGVNATRATCTVESDPFGQRIWHPPPRSPSAKECRTFHPCHTVEGDPCSQRVRQPPHRSPSGVPKKPPLPHSGG